MPVLGRCVVVGVAWLALLGRAAAVAPEIKDEGKFFSSEAVKKANEMIREIAKKYDKDLLIETYPSVPAEDLEKFKKMSKEEQAEYISKWAIKRAETAVVRGVYVLICKEPPKFDFKVSRKALPKFDGKAQQKLKETILEEFRDKRYDEGLMALVKAFRESLGGPK